MDLKKSLGTMKAASGRAVRHPIDTGLRVVGRSIGLVRGTVVVLASTVAGDRRDRPAERDSAAPGAAPAPVPAAAAPTPASTSPPAEPEAADRLGAPEDIETPVGTTGAGEGYNPDTGETDLQQPGTEPLMDPSTTKAVASESETLRRAAERDL